MLGVLGMRYLSSSLFIDINQSYTHFLISNTQTTGTLRYLTLLASSLVKEGASVAKECARMRKNIFDFLCPTSFRHSQSLFRHKFRVLQCINAVVDGLKPELFGNISTTATLIQTRSNAAGVSLDGLPMTVNSA